MGVRPLEVPAGERVLAIEADGGERPRLRALLEAPGRELLLATSASEGLALLRESDVDLVLLSLDLPDLPGLRALDVFRDRAPRSPILALTGPTTVEQAVAAVRRGAVDVLERPVPPERLDAAISRALTEARSLREVERAARMVQDRYGFSHLLTRSPRMLRVFDQIRAVAGTDATVLIRGETGTGKELVSRAIHERSRRRDQPFISVNCGAFTETLLESELFGHERGSFTGAAGRRRGLFEMADGGTLFLDELGETSLNVQVNLLRVLEEMSFRRVGGQEEVRVDVRILAATNAHLEQAVAEGRFREDLYYRLDVFPIRLPPLRERTEDIPLLVRHFLENLAEEYQLEPPVVTQEAMQALLAYRWPGNVRQLRSLCERWVITRHGRRLERDDLPTDLGGAPDPTRLDPPPVDLGRPLTEQVEEARERIERSWLRLALQANHGHLERTARMAGITRRTLYNKLRHYGIRADEFRRSVGG